MTAPYLWTGTLHKTADGIAATITDPMGFTIVLTGMRTAEGYALVGTPGPTPEWAVLPGDEDEPTPKKPPRDTAPEKPIKPPKPGQSKCLGNLCLDCGVAHGPPSCGWDSQRACPGCGQPIGFLTPRMVARDVCCRCEMARGGET